MDFDYYKSYEMSWGTLGTIRSFPNFHPDRDVLEIQKALESKDAQTLVRILTNRSNAQRQVIAKTYQTITGKDLVAGVKKALSGDLENLLVALLMTPLQFEAHRLRQAMEGLGTDEETLMEILCTTSNEKLKEISTAYTDSYKRDLVKDLKGETSGDFTKLILALLNKQEIPAAVNKDIETLTASLNGKKADAEPWISILTSRDMIHLNRVLLGLELQRGQTAAEAVEKNFTGDTRLGLKVRVRCIENPSGYLAGRLETMKASIVHGIMVSHCEDNLLAIRAAYIRQNGASLYTNLQKHFKGDHLQALLAICRSED